MAGSGPLLKTNRKKYRSQNLTTGYIQPVQSYGTYTDPLIETIPLTANTELAHPLRTGTGKIRIYSADLIPFNVAWESGEAFTNFVRTIGGKTYEQDQLHKGTGPSTIYLGSVLASTVVIETWLTN